MVMFSKGTSIQVKLPVGDVYGGIYYGVIEDLVDEGKAKIRVLGMVEYPSLYRHNTERGFITGVKIVKENALVTIDVEDLCIYNTVKLLNYNDSVKEALNIYINVVCKCIERYLNVYEYTDSYIKSLKDARKLRIMLWKRRHKYTNYGNPQNMDVSLEA